MNKIKSQLRMLAEKQEIHDLHENIIKNVDTSKVVYEPSITKRSLFRFTPVLFGAAAMALVAVVGVKALNKGGSSTSPNTTKLEITQELVSQTYSREVYTLMNIASAFDKMTFTTPLGDTTTKRMTPSEEYAFASDLNSYMLNIEHMLGVVSLNAYESNNIDTSYNYDTVIKASSPNVVYDYNFYYTEDIVSEKNIGEYNYKRNSNLDGVLVFNDSEYSVVGTKAIRSDSIEYETRLTLSQTRYVVIDETFTASKNVFSYDVYSIFKDEPIKHIEATQQFNTDGSLKKLSFKTDYENVESISCLSDGTLSCKLKSRDSEYVYVTKTLEGYTYSFKNSTNSYLIKF